MITIPLIVTVTAVVAVNVLFYRWYVRFAQARNFTDVPNHRSAHEEPVPGGGGIGFGVTAIAGMAVYLLLSGQGFNMPMGTTLAVMSAVLLTGWADDFRGLPALFRFGIYSLAAVAVMLFVGHFSSFYIPFLGMLETGMVGYLLAFLWILGWLNAYNFMDGLDGMAALQAMVISFGWCVFAWKWNLPVLFALNGLLLAGSGVFLVFNWSPAKVFMGDGGSVLLGLSFGVMPLLATTLSENVLAGYVVWPAVLMLWPFLFDSFYTFVRRAAAGEDLLDPHRSHLYQRLHKIGWSHDRVTVLYAFYALLSLAAAILFEQGDRWTRLGVGIFVLTISAGHVLMVHFLEQRVRGPSGAAE